MRSNRLEMMREGNVVRISTVSRLKEEREALRAAQDAERELEPLRVRYVRSTTPAPTTRSSTR
jgi:hypothetical protein